MNINVRSFFVDNLRACNNCGLRGLQVLFIKWITEVTMWFVGIKE